MNEGIGHIWLKYPIENLHIDALFVLMLSRQVEHQQDFKKGKGVRGGIQGGAGGRRRQGRKQKVSSNHDVSSNDYGISAS